MLFVAMKHYWGGYVLVRIQGECTERFFNMCAYRNIAIWDIKKAEDITTFKMSMRGFKSCRDICRKTHTRLIILQKFGAFTWSNALKKRYVFLGGFLLFVAFFAVASRFIWSVDIRGISNTSELKLRENLSDLGLKEGAYKGKIDPKYLKESLLLRNADLSWVWVDIKGTKAIVTVREKNPAPYMVPTDEPCDVVSNKEGILARKNVRTGVCQYEIGDYVLPGDVLIAGTVQSENANIPVWYVHADGEFFLRTVYDKMGEFQLSAEEKIYTGQQKKRYTVHILGWEIPLGFSKKEPYDTYETQREDHELRLGKQQYIGIGYSVDIMKEYTIVKVPLSQEESKKRAKKRMKQEMNQSLSLHYTVISEEYEYEQTSHNTLKVTMHGEYEEEVGVEKRIDTTQTNEQNLAENTKEKELE